MDDTKRPGWPAWRIQNTDANTDSANKSAIIGVRTTSRSQVWDLTHGTNRRMTGPAICTRELTHLVMPGSFMRPATASGYFSSPFALESIWSNQIISNQ